jgi:putative transposase
LNGSREDRGRAIANTSGALTRIDENTYSVQSQFCSGAYTVVSTETGWSCGCPDHTYRAVKCKHIYAVEFSQGFRNVVQSGTTISPVEFSQCRYCGSPDVVKNALRHNKYGDIQRFKCSDCSKRFSVNLGFERMKSSPQAITQAMQLFFTGESLRGVQKFLRLQGVNVSHVAVLKWIRKYVGLMSVYLEKMTPKLSETWRADELYVKMKGNMKYLFAMMDDETRFWIAQEVADSKERHQPKGLFYQGLKMTNGRAPAVLITDGLPSYHYAFKKVFAWKTTPTKKPIHKREIAFDGGVHNNKMERMNGEIRDREKVMRGLKNMDTPVLKGLQIYHNFVRPHEALHGQTPSERAGIKVEGGDRWLTLIQNASVEGRASKHYQSPPKGGFR